MNRGVWKARPVTRNSWEAVYLDHDLETLVELAEAGAGVGVERFVRDDGWFSGRTRAGRLDTGCDTLAGWLGPLISRVHELGMEFRLWVAPEMISLDSRPRARPLGVGEQARRVATAHRYGPCEVLR